MKPLQMISNLNDFMAEPTLFMKDLAQHGGIREVYIGHKRFVFVFDPELAHDVLIRKSQNYLQNRTVFDRIQPVTGKKGLVQLQGKESQVARAQSRPMFSTQSLDAAKTTIESYCDEMLSEVSEGINFDPTEAMTFLILRTTFAILLGMEAKELSNRIGQKFLRLNYLCGVRMRALVPAPLFLPTFKNREIKSLQTEIRNLIAQQIQFAKDTGVPKVFRDDSALIDQCMTFLFAGHETTASSIAFSLLLLAKNPQYQHAVADGDQEMTMAIYKESLRLFPPAYMLARESKEDDILGSTHVKKSDQVIVGVASLHRNPKYFDRPEEFIPERFLQKTKHPMAFIPFGAGGKSCVGERLAYLEAGIILQKICQKFKLVSNEEPIQHEPLITLHPLSHQYIQLRSRNQETV